MWTNTPVYNVAGQLVFGLLRPSIIPDPSDQIFTVTQPNQNNLQFIANTLYNDPSLWWAIAELNFMLDPLTDLPTGTDLRVATQQRMNLILNQ